MLPFEKTASNKNRKDFSWHISIWNFKQRFSISRSLTCLAEHPPSQNAALTGRTRSPAAVHELCQRDWLLLYKKIGSSNAWGLAILPSNHFLRSLYWIPSLDPFTPLTPSSGTHSQWEFRLLKFVTVPKCVQKQQDLLVEVIAAEDLEQRRRERLCQAVGVKNCASWWF